MRGGYFMKKELLWALFKKTGKIEYYMKYKEVLNAEKGDENA